MQQHATYDTYNPREEAAEDRAEARSGSFGTTCIHTHEFPRCLARRRRPRAVQFVGLGRPWRADKADCSFIITNIVSGSSSWARTRHRRRRLRQGTYYLLTAKGVPVDPVKVNPPPPPAAPARRSVAGDLDLDLPAHSKKVASLSTPSPSRPLRHHPRRRHQRLESRPLRGHSGWDGGLCACKHRMHRGTAMAISIRWSLIMTWSHFPLQLSRNVDEGPASTAATPAAGCCGQPAAGQSWQHVALERLSMLGLFPGRSSRGRRSSSEEEAAATLRAHADASVVVWLS